MAVRDGCCRFCHPWFWLFGLVILAGLPVFAKDVLFANEGVVTLMLALFAMGVGGGSILAERLLKGEVSARFVPWSGFAMAGFAIDLSLASATVPPTAILADVATFLGRSGSWRVIVDLVCVAMAGGLFTVPLYALIRTSEPSTDPASLPPTRSSTLPPCRCALGAGALSGH